MAFFRVVVRDGPPVLLDAPSKIEAETVVRAGGHHVIITVEVPNFNTTDFITDKAPKKDVNLWANLSKEERHSISVVYNTLLKQSGGLKECSSYKLSRQLLEEFKINRHDLK